MNKRERFWLKLYKSLIEFLEPIALGIIGGFSFWLASAYAKVPSFWTSKIFLLIVIVIAIIIIILNRFFKRRYHNKFCSYCGNIKKQS